MFVFSECRVYCQVEVSATNRFLVQRTPTYCGVSKWITKTKINMKENLTLRRPRPTRAVELREQLIQFYLHGLGHVFRLNGLAHH
jgi:hypothetical protein